MHSGFDGYDLVMATFIEVEELEETECSGTSEEFYSFGEMVDSSQSSSSDPEPHSSYPPSSRGTPLGNTLFGGEWNPRPK
jgi:hypothetical protein